MVDEVRLADLLTELNDMMGPVTPYKLAAADPAALNPIDKNAHYMPKKVYDQLVANIKRDGNLASIPFCWKRQDGTFMVLSGNHRVEAAKRAGVPLILLLYTDEKLSRSQVRAHQISHNALVGKDNPQLLRELYEEIEELGLKVYSGIDDSVLGTLMPVNLERLTEAQLQFEEMTFVFLPHEIERIEEVLERLGEAVAHRHAMPLAAFARFFELLITYKEATNIINSATALLGMCDIVQDWLATRAGASAEERAS
jgi:hypothetical protein